MPKSIVLGFGFFCAKRRDIQQTMKAIEKLVALFCIIVFVTFMMNHGLINFAGVDWVKNRVTDTINSPEGQEVIDETRQISKDVFFDLFNGVKNLITGEDSSSEKDSLTEATLLSCIDGKTLSVGIDGKKTTVRLIGIDIPGSEYEAYYEMTNEYVETLLENINTLYLEYDVSTIDTDGRTLAYVWFSNKPNEPGTNMLNAILVKNGYADDVVYLPNNKYSDVFMNERVTAQKNETGLWKHDEISSLWRNK